MRENLTYINGVRKRESTKDTQIDGGVLYPHVPDFIH